MSDQWQYQVRIDLTDELAEVARRDPADPALDPLPAILARHDATHEIPVRRVRRLRRRGRTTRASSDYPLYQWTKATIENPAKKAKYLKSFTLYVGGDEVYAKDKADALEAELQPLVGGGLITRLAKHDTNPANNPQPPARYRR